MWHWTTWIVALVGVLSCVPISAKPNTNQHSGNNNKQKILVSVRIDTANAETKEIVEQWIAYLNSTFQKPLHSPTEYNTDWAEQEQQFYVLGTSIQQQEYDLTKQWIFQDERSQTSLQCLILSIEPDPTAGLGFRCIRTLFSYHDSVSGLSLPLALHRVYAQPAIDGWKFRGAYNVITQKWEQVSIGALTFRVSPYHSLNRQLAQKSVRWCDSISRLFELTLNPSTVVVCTSRDELASTIGLDYYAAPPYGLTYQKNRLMFSGLNSPWYPHELVHLIFAPYHPAHKFLHEGVATWLGGSLGDEFTTLVKRVGQTYSSSDGSIDSILSRPVECAEAYYTLGGVLCFSAYQRGGAEAVRLLLSCGSNDAELYTCIRTLLGVSKHQVADFLRREMQILIDR
jgi:hypothetical protein